MTLDTPPASLTKLREVECPMCRATIERVDEAYPCEECGTVYVWGWCDYYDGATGREGGSWELCQR